MHSENRETICIVPVVSAHQAPWSYPRELREFRDIHGLPYSSRLHDLNGSRRRHHDRSRRRLQRFGVTEHLVPETPGVAFFTLLPPELLLLLSRIELSLHSCGRRLEGVVTAGPVHTLSRLPFDEKEPVGAAAACLFTDGAGVELGRGRNRRGGSDHIHSKFRVKGWMSKWYRHQR